MAHDFTGRVLFANGRTASDVRVRVFDRDAPGKGDDDLTLKEGMSERVIRKVLGLNIGKFTSFLDFFAFELVRFC